MVYYHQNKIRRTLRLTKPKNFITKNINIYIVKNGRKNIFMKGK